MAAQPLTDPIDFILLSNQKSPGVAIVEGANSPRKWDERRGYGLSGYTLWFTGIGLSQFNVDLQLASNQDWSDWHSWRSIVQKTPLGRRPRALDIWHPFLEDLGIKSVVVEDVLQPVEKEPGLWVITLKFREWRLPKIQLAKPNGSDERPKSTDPVDKLLDNLSGQVQELLE